MGRPLQRWTSLSGLYSYCRIARLCSCSSLSQASTVVSPGIRTRSGRVLMKRPTMSSTPSTSAGRPEATVPKTTSSVRA